MYYLIMYKWCLESASLYHPILSFSSRETTCAVLLIFLFITLLKCQFKATAVVNCYWYQMITFCLWECLTELVAFWCFLMWFCFDFLLWFCFEIWYKINLILYIEMVVLFEQATISLSWLLSNCHGSWILYWNPFTPLKRGLAYRIDLLWQLCGVHLDDEKVSLLTVSQVLYPYVNFLLGIFNAPSQVSVWLMQQLQNSAFLKKEI